MPHILRHLFYGRPPDTFEAAPAFRQSSPLVLSAPQTLWGDAEPIVRQSKRIMPSRRKRREARMDSEPESAAHSTQVRCRETAMTLKTPPSAHCHSSSIASQECKVRHAADIGSSSKRSWAADPRGRFSITASRKDHARS
jgi:hypothetical protein